MKRIFERGIADMVIDFAGTVAGNLIRQQAKQWLIENAPQYLEGWSTEAVIALIDNNISLWDDVLTEDIRTQALQHIPTFRNAFSPPDKAASLLLEVLGQIRPDLAKVLTREYIESELLKIEREVDNAAAGN